ncbi:unnamed protein product, partial [marine sediment metagenome]
VKYFDKIILISLDSILNLLFLVFFFHFNKWIIAH